MAEHNNTGNKGEIMAANFLKEKGYVILETNWRYKNLEADIISTYNNTLVITEVKTRKSNYFGEPETFVNKAKQKNLIKAANEYVKLNDIHLEVRFDIISVILTSNLPIMNHIPDAFYAMRN